jgi:predicted Ser/Thr protein kinase
MNDRDSGSMHGEDFIDRADRTLEATYEEPMSLSEYVDLVLDHPGIASHATKYLLDAIEAAGTRTVIEEGEEKERYRFFDDPENDGEHAILGNTEVLNRLVDDLRSIATRRGKDEKIVWLDGPTATGKSELKRCLNISGAEGSSSGMTYGEEAIEDEDDWYESPVQSHPLTVFPPEVRRDIVARINENSDDHVDIHVEGRLDPFSREAYDYLEEQYRRNGVEDLFSAVTDPIHLRVKNFVVDVGRGIGVLHSEDEGTPKERLVGTWMAGMLRELDSRGRKNPQAFSYDGVLSQGNGLLTVVEDAGQHADLLQKLLNVPDEGSVKLDKGIGMDIDTQLIIISNPDLDAQLNQHADREGQDPLKALKRRLNKHEFTYLTNLSLEIQLLLRELTGDTAVWEPNSWTELEERIRQPVELDVRSGDGVRDRELAPHTLEAAALYNVVSRLDTGDLPDSIDLVDKALLFDRGYLREDDERVDIEEFEFNDGASDGEHGIPVTYTRDVIADLLHEETDRHHAELPVESVIMPRDVLDRMAEGLGGAPVFSNAEAAEYEERVVPVKNYVFGQQEEDVLAAIMREKRVDEETVEEYIEHVYAWATDDQIENDRGEYVDPDPLKMKVFEVEHLGRFSEAQYDGNEPSPAVEEFRTDRIITALNRHAWHNRDDTFRVEDVNPKEIPVIETVLGTHDWEDVRRTYEDLEPHQWDEPPADTETARIKSRTIENMMEMFEYSEAAAELTSRHVMDQVSYRWD